MFEQSISITGRKKMTCVETKRGVDDFTKGNIRQISCRRYFKNKIHDVELEV
jgi:hypothetical protein